MITNWKHLTTAEFQLYKPECTGANRYTLRCEYKNDECFIQVPLSTVYRCDSTKKISIGFPNVVDVPDKHRFVKKMEEIDNWFHTQFQAIWKTHLEPTATATATTSAPPVKKTRKKEVPISIQWFPFIRWNPTRTSAYCSFTIQQEKTRNDQGKIVVRPYLEIFDRRRERLPMEAIEPYSYAYHIIHADHIWVSGDATTRSYSAGIQWSVIQTRLYPSIFRMNDCFIREDRRDFPDTMDGASASHTPVAPPLPPSVAPPALSKEEHPVYGKYAKMKRMGIPDGAIEQKIIQDRQCLQDDGQAGMTLTEFQRWYNGSVSSSSPSIPNVSSRSGAGNPMSVMAGLLSAIRGGNVALKKVSDESRIPRNVDSIIPVQLKDKFTPPSANDLLQIISKLRKR